MDPYCSFCGKGDAEVEKLIAGPSACICNECVGLCVHVLGENVPPTGGEVSSGISPLQVLIRVPDGSVHASEPTTPWRPLVVFGEKLEWCAARSRVRGAAPLLVVAVQRRGADGPATGAVFNAKVKPTREHAKEVALKYLLGRAE